MKLLLTTLNSKYVHSNLALKYLYNVVIGSDFNVTLKEFTLNNEKDYIYSEILEPAYDIVCFSCYIWNIEATKELCANLKKARPEMKILLGGPEVSYDCKAFMEENSWCDYIIKGEGEIPFFNFCKNVSLGHSLVNVEGLVLRSNGTIIENDQPTLIEMDKLTFPYAHLPVEKDRVVYYETSRGCPFNCAYCLSSVDKTTRALSLDRVKSEFNYFLMHNVKQVKLLDRTFNYDRARARDIWRYLISRDNGNTNFHFEICGELIDSEDLAIFAYARPGLFKFEIGIQSFNERALRAVGRSTNPETLLSKIKKLTELPNIEVHADLIAGLPHEDMLSFRNSFNKAYESGAEELQLGFLKLLKGTSMRADSHKLGYIYRKEAPYEIISSGKMSSVDLVKLKKLERVLDVFHNRGGFGRAIEFLMDALEFTPFDFYMDFSEFYHENGYQHRYHKKEDNYRILYGYALSKELLYPETYKDLTERNMVLLDEDLVETMNFDAVKKFRKKGWMING